MEHEEYYNYINLLMFSTLMKYENRRSFGLDVLESYLDNVLLVAANTYDEDDDYNEFEDINSLVNLNNFLQQYSGIVHVDNGILYLDSKVTYNDLTKMCNDLEVDDEIATRLNIACECESSLEILGINSIPRIINKYFEIEREIETYYIKENYHSSNKIKSNLNKLLLCRRIFLNNMSSNPQYRIDAFANVCKNNLENNGTYEYPCPPIDLESWEFSEYYDEDDCFGHIDDRIYDLYQLAIFSDVELCGLRLSEYLSELNIDSFAQEEVKINDAAKWGIPSGYNDACSIIPNVDNIDAAFYLTYIKNIDQYVENFGNNDILAAVRNRLLYTLDMPGIFLYEKQGFDNIYKKLCETELEEDVCEFVKDEVRFMAGQIFYNYDQFTIRKLLFIQTYYSLSKDNKIREIVESYKDNKNYKVYSNIIYGRLPNNPKR